MAHHFQSQKIMPFKAELIKEILMDIEKYPEFLPWCGNARVLSVEDNITIADLEINFKGFTEQYTSGVLLEPTNDGYIIKTNAISGPFKEMLSIWEIKKQNNLSEVKFLIDFSFKSKILDLVVGTVFGMATEKMILAFEKRADILTKRLI